MHQVCCANDWEASYVALTGIFFKAPLSLGAEREVALIKPRETIRTSLNQRGAKVTLGLRCCI